MSDGLTLVLVITIFMLLGYWLCEFNHYLIRIIKAHKNKKGGSHNDEHINK